MWPDFMWRQVYWLRRIGGAVARRVGGQLATRYHRGTLAALGPRSRFQPGVNFTRPGIVSIGADCHIARGVAASAEIPGAPLIIGDGVQINRDVHLDTTGGLTIGNGTLISEGAVIYTHDHGLDPRAAPISCPKVINRDVWIGARALILPQCKRIGQGAVIGAGAVVVADVPDGAIMGGNPARVIRYREISLQEVA